MPGRFILWVAIFILFSCTLSLHAASPNRVSTHARVVSELNGGYYLLNHLAEQESSLPMIFLVKDAPKEISDYAKQIERIANETKSSLEQMADKDSSIRLDQNPLPKIEQDVRASIRDDKENQLVFDTSGTEFIRALLVTQIEASTYAVNLSNVLAEQETNPQRAKVLRHLSSEWLKMRDNAFRLLRHY